MLVTPVLKGNVARNCHPWGCRAQLQAQVDYLRGLPAFAGAKKVLVLGASSGFGLASRLALLIAGGADSIGVSYEKGPSDKGLGTAGWYNNIFFRQLAEAEGRVGSNIIGDAFQEEIRQQAIEAIRRELGGKVDLVVYSLATGRRKTAEGSWQSALKTRGEALQGYSVNLETEQLEPETVEVANAQEVEGTVKVMGGEDWSLWLKALAKADVLAEGCQTLAFSYVGPEQCAAIYRDGTIGAAKTHLHMTAQRLDRQLQEHLNGHAYACVAKALVTKASVYIPVFSPYIALLYKLMKAQGLHEECTEQAYRLFAGKLFGPGGVATDEQGLIRMDDWELQDSVQQQVATQLPLLTPDNFKELTDFAGMRESFMRLNGFEVPGVDYMKEIDVTELMALKP